MYIAEHHTSTKKPFVALNDSTIGDLTLIHPKELLQLREENQVFSPDPKQLARYLDACCDCV